MFPIPWHVCRAIAPLSILLGSPPCLLFLRLVVLHCALFIRSISPSSLPTRRQLSVTHISRIHSSLNSSSYHFPPPRFCSRKRTCFFTARPVSHCIHSTCPNHPPRAPRRISERADLYTYRPGHISSSKAACARGAAGGFGNSLSRPWR